MLACSTGYTSTSIATDIDFVSILSANTIACDSGATATTCTINSTWGLDVKLNCRSIYTNPVFFTGTTITDAPTQQDYVDAIDSKSIKFSRRNLNLKSATELFNKMKALDELLE